jgi:mannonate dehydratase
MRVALGLYGNPTDQLLAFAGQLGVTDVILHLPDVGGDGRWELEPLLRLRERIEAFGLHLESMENIPWEWYEKAMLGAPGADEEIENVCYTVKNLGRAGIPIFGFCWMPNSVWTTSVNTPARGGARARSFDLNLIDKDMLTHGRVYTEDEMWASFERFIRRVLPAAEEAGVKLALHPDDPPVESLGGIARIFRNFDGFKRAIEMAASPNFGLNFCLGTWSEMGPGVDQALTYFGEKKKIFYVHFRDVKGHVPRFVECFPGEGNVDVVKAVRILKAADFDGCMENDHVPAMLDEEGWAPTSRAYVTGYIAGLVAAVS